jgi:hypothetical protein
VRREHRAYLLIGGEVILVICALTAAALYGPCRNASNSDDQELTGLGRVITEPHSLNQIPVRYPSAVGCGRDNPL